jgi:hypothetical protein
MYVHEKAKIGTHVKVGLFSSVIIEVKQSKKTGDGVRCYTT